MESSRTAFTVPFPEARKTRLARLLYLIFFLLYWVLWGLGLYGPPATAHLPLRAIGTVFFVLSVACFVYEWRKYKKLVPLINKRFAEELFTHMQQVYPPDVNILEVQRSVAVKRADGSISLWGIERKKDRINAFPLDY